MRLTRPFALIASMALAAPLLLTARADATIEFSQQVNLRNDPTNSVGIKKHYTSFIDGYQDCSWQGDGSSDHGPCYEEIGSGDLTIIPKTYRLVDENRKKDYYLLDLTVSTSNIKGNKDFAYLDAQLEQTSKVISATGSGGVESVSECKEYPITIEAGWGVLAAGTEVASFSVRCHRTYIHDKAVSHGTNYHVTNLNAVRSVTFQRFVVVAAGRKPTFRWRVRYPTDTCVHTTVGTASGSAESQVCHNHSETITRSIGTGGGS